MDVGTMGDHTKELWMEFGSENFRTMGKEFIIKVNEFSSAEVNSTFIP